MGRIARGWFKPYPDIIIRIYLEFFRSVPFQKKTESIQLTMCQYTKCAGRPATEYIAGFKLLNDYILQHVSCFILNFSPHIKLLGKSRKAEEQ